MRLASADCFVNAPEDFGNSGDAYEYEQEQE
jgi:hypothetical protein